MAALKPAPVLAGWFNFYATSGMACYDYLIGDDVVITLLGVRGNQYKVGIEAPKSVSVHRRTTGEYLANNKYRQESTIERLQVPMAEPLFLELQHFAQSILDGRP